MIKKIACFLFAITLFLSFCACGSNEKTVQQSGESSPASQAIENEMSEDEITELVTNLVSEAQKIFWWYHSDMSDDLEIDIDADPLEVDGGYWQKVNRFSTMAELKAATESVFTLDFCKANFYDKIELGKFKEIDGALYHNVNVGGMGWIYSLPKKYLVQSSDNNIIVLTAVCDGLDIIVDEKGEAEYEFELTLLSDGDGWKISSYYNYTSEGYTGDLLLKDGLAVYDEDIKAVANALAGAGMLGSTWTEPWSEESVYDLSFVRFYCMMNPGGQTEIPAADFELFIHGFFNVSTDNLHKIFDYDSDKNIYKVSPDVSVSMMTSQIDDFFKIDSIVQNNGKINLSYRILWGRMAAEGDGSDTASAGTISFRRAGRFFHVDSVTETDNYSDKYD